MKTLVDPAVEAFFASAGAGKCARCGESSFHDNWKEQEVALGDEEAHLRVKVPVVTCDSCGFEFTDRRAEKIRHAAICSHQGLLAPDEIRAIRSDLGMSRREFDEAYGISPATMERWESGRLYPSRSLNTLLKALQNPSTAVRLDSRRSADPDGVVVFGRFNHLSARQDGVESARRRSEGFRLSVNS